MTAVFILRFIKELIFVHFNNRSGGGGGVGQGEKR